MGHEFNLWFRGKKVTILIPIPWYPTASQPLPTKTTTVKVTGEFHFDRSAGDFSPLVDHPFLKHFLPLSSIILTSAADDLFNSMVKISNLGACFLCDASDLRACLSTEQSYLAGLGILSSIHTKQGFPGGVVVKNMSANARDVDFILWSGRFPGEGYGNPLQYSGKSHGQRSLVGCSPQRHNEYDTTECTHTHTHTHTQNRIPSSSHPLQQASPMPEIQGLLWLFYALCSYIWSKIKPHLTYFLIVFRFFSFPKGPTPLWFQVTLATDLGYWNCLLTCLPPSFLPDLSQQRTPRTWLGSMILSVLVYSISVSFLTFLRVHRWIKILFLISLFFAIHLTHQAPSTLNYITSIHSISPFTISPLF